MKKIKTQNLIFSLFFSLSVLFLVDLFLDNKDVRAMASSDIDGVESVVENLKSDETPVIEDEQTETEDAIFSSGVIQDNEEILGDFKTHSAQDYSFSVPSDWIVYEIQSELNSYVQILNYDPASVEDDHYVAGKYFKIEIVKLDNPENISLKNWVDNFIESQDYPTEVLSENNIEVDGYEAIYQIEKILPMNIVHPGIFVKKGKNIFILNVSPIDKFDVVFEKILKSIKFK